MTFNTVETLTPPSVGAEFVREEITCIRPTREGTFNLSIEIRNRKLIIHDYGHGGAGWTLVFGCVSRAIRNFQKAVAENPQYKGAPLRVVGGGAHGLLMAIELKQRGYSVRIVAKDYDELASHKGAGTFAPGPLVRSENDEEVLGEVLNESFLAWSEIASQKHPLFKEGAEFVPLYTFEGTELGLRALIRQGLIPGPERVEVSFGGGKSNSMLKYASIFMDTRKVLSLFHQRVADLGIQKDIGFVEDFDQLEERIIFDCTGLGGGVLNQDIKMAPVQGHLINLKNQPDIKLLKYMIYFQFHQDMKPQKDIIGDEFGNKVEDFLYFTPKGGGTLGGSYIKGEGRLDTNAYQHRRILERAINFFGPSALKR